ncbi:hypothetical protein CDL12_10493 [Handroanthus impetiginosus]|uniref:Protein EARLY FLOWERING 3 n=1 Tax=Handroanthus impetiginosus TaxID=429701 RepID=A0A2G9HH06_9LAMI|nr:hypothetical protein CDL12_10493 [Handroanthus impetiginosus]
MKRGKDGEKLMGPMFPRLHVNDTEKGGPRAPPRNKMALYEQLSIPSQRFAHAVLPCNRNNTAANLVHPASQGSGNDWGMFFSHEVPPRHLSDKQYSQYSDVSTPLTQMEQRKKLDEDDYRVPIFVHSVPSKEFDTCSNSMDREKLSSIEKSGGLKKQSISSLSHKPGENPVNSIERLKTDDNAPPELCAGPQHSSDRQIRAVPGEDVAAVAKRNSSSSKRASSSEDQNIVHDLSIDTESHEDGFCRSMQTGNLERGDSVSETSILDNVSGLEITPDDVVGVIGQKHFWKARKAIANQQRVFAVQVFELHRLIKVQKLIAESPHLLLEDSAYLNKPSKALPRKKLPLSYAVKAMPNVPKPKGDSEKQDHKKEFSAENTVERASLPSAQKSSTNVPPPSISSDHNPQPWPFSQLQGHQWLIPVMSPSEGLVYKPHPGPGFIGQACGPPIPNPMMSNFVSPAYGVPAPPAQYHMSSFPPAGYFPPAYGIPIMNPSSFSGSSVEQMTPPSMQGLFSHHSSSTMPSQRNRNVLDDSNTLGSEFPKRRNGTVPDYPSTLPSQDKEIQASAASSPAEGQSSHKATNVVEGRNVLPLFPTAPAISPSGSCPQVPTLDHPIRVIKVVPHNARSASESAARIFQSIQEERKQYDSA